MEFSTLGQHCSMKTCNQLDFLPMKCNLCSIVFCKEHIKYEEHQCPSFYRKNVEVPVCSSCNNGASLRNRECRCDPSLKKREKVYSYKCSVISCKQHEAIEVKCYKCSKRFCLKHRFPDDHKCQRFENIERSVKISSDTTIECTRNTNTIVENKNQSNNATTTEDDKLLALTVQLSLNRIAQEENDFLLAKALQESEQEETRRNRATVSIQR
ncbi:unnamed protein product [Adineta steineri]|uniref:AN1-type domain-containing protein n=1 Tax=Adineta steineri TaxID=433720 RepID=A0A813RF59_9BILA|nr:unnamed protein product [Adineta steineri]